MQIYNMDGMVHDCALLWSKPIPEMKTTRSLLVRVPRPAFAGEMHRGERAFGR